MGLIIGLLLAGVVFIWLAKRIGRKHSRTLPPVDLYPTAPSLNSRPQHVDLDPGTPPASARSALWLRNNSHRPTYDDEDNEGSAPFEIAVSIETYDDETDDDERYASFVSTMWGRPVADLGKLKGFRIGYTGERHPVQLVSLARSERGDYLYVNCYEAGEKKTYAADERHEWEVMGVKVDSSAFMGAALGVPAAVALGRREYPQSPQEARTFPNDAFEGAGRRFVIEYEDGAGQPSYRMVSKVVRQPQAGRFTANCHFRYGARRTFLFERLRSVEDADTGQLMDLVAFIKGSIARKRTQKQ